MAVLWVDRMAVDVRGEGDAVVFVHGLGGSVNAWTPLLPALARQRCIRIDLPGAGRSHKAYALGSANGHGGHVSTESQAEAVLRVFEALGLPQAHVVGHSYGTLIAQMLAAQAPARVRSLSLFGALLEPSQAMRDLMRTRAALAREQGMFEIAEAVSQAGLSASSRETQPVGVAYVRETVGAQDPEGYARNCLALGESHAARLELIRCPTLIVNGDEDVVTPLSGARQLADRLRGHGTPVRVEVLGRCGHWPMLERTADAQRLLRDFLDKLR
jgi:pimeloyl-ACP methyl ester carboxylesterase